MIPFHEKLNHYILKNDYSIYRIAKLSGVERTGLQRCISGQRLLPKDALYTIMDFLKLDYKEKADLLNCYTIAQIGELKYHQWEYIQRIIESLSLLFHPAPAYALLEKGVQLSTHPDSHFILHGKYAITQTVQAFMEYGLYETEHPEISLFLPDDKDFLSAIIPSPRVLASKPVFNQLIQLTPTTNSIVKENYNLRILDMLLPFGLSVYIDYNVYYTYTEMGLSSPSGIIFPYYIILNHSVLILISDNIESAAILRITEHIEYYRSTFLSTLSKAQKLMNIYADTATTLNHFIDVENNAQGQFFLEYQPCLFTFTDADMIDRYILPSLENRENFIEIAKKRLRQLQSAASSYNIFSVKGLEFFIDTGIMTDIPSGIAAAIPPEDRLVILYRLRNAFEHEGYTYRMINPDYFQFPDFISIGISAEYGIDFFIYDKENQSRYLYLRESTLSKSFLEFITGITNTTLVYSKEKTLEILDHYISSLIAK